MHRDGVPALDLRDAMPDVVDLIARHLADIGSSLRQHN
jgi:hypothetical protein